MLKVLVTGAAGFIGYHVVKRLMFQDIDVVGIDNINDYYDVNLKYARLKEVGISKESKEWYKGIISSKKPNYTFIRMNLEDKKELNELFDKSNFDIVCNLAAQAGVRHSIDNPQVYINSNIVGFFNILEACREFSIKHLIYASSSSVYGNSSEIPLSTKNKVDNPISLYAATKKSNELMAHAYSHLFDLPTTGLRFFTVYGPWGRPDMAYFLFTKAIISNTPIKVYNNGDMVRDFTYIDDIVEGITRIINSTPQNHSALVKDPGSSGDTPYRVYNIGNSSPTKLMDLIKAIEHNLGKVSIKKFLPIQPGDVEYTEADVSDLIRDFGYKPETSVEAGIREFVCWYKEFYKSS